MKKAIKTPIVKTQRHIERLLKLKSIYASLATLEVHGAEDRATILAWKDEFLDSFQVKALHTGLPFTLKTYKYIRLCVMRFLCGIPLPHGSSQFRVGRFKDGLPKAVGKIRHLIHAGDPSHLRVILTVLNYGRTITLPLEGPDTDPLMIRPIIRISHQTEEWEHLDEFRAFVDQWFKRFTKDSLTQEELSPINSSFYLAAKSGPNGRPALASSLWEAGHMPDDMVDLIRDADPILAKKLERCREQFSSYERKEFFPLLYTTKHEVIKDKKGKSKTQRVKVPYAEDSPFKWARLSRLPDKEGKTRVVCLYNYWAQCWLKSIHSVLIKVLRKCPWDTTFDHSSFKGKLQLEIGNSYHSIDLKDATDRFPLSIQKVVISSLFGEKLANTWERFFRMPVGHWDKKQPDVRYGVGQPMGAYSSWPAFALTHGLVLEFLRKKHKLPPKSFCILGDDVVVSNNDLASEYISFLKWNDIPFSPEKTMSSPDTFEFAKRLVRRGKEITPFPTTSLLEYYTSYPNLAETLREAVDRGWFVRKPLSRCAAVSILLNGLKVNHIHMKRITTRLKQYLRYPFGKSLYGDLWEWKSFLESASLPVSCTNWQVYASCIDAVHREVLHQGTSNDLWSFYITGSTRVAEVLQSLSLAPADWSSLELSPIADDITPESVLEEHNPIIGTYFALAMRVRNVMTTMAMAIQFKQDGDCDYRVNDEDYESEIIELIADLKAITTDIHTGERKFRRILKVKSTIMEKTIKEYPERIYNLESTDQEDVELSESKPHELGP